MITVDLRHGRVEKERERRSACTYEALLAALWKQTALTKILATQNESKTRSTFVARGIQMQQEPMKSIPQIPIRIWQAKKMTVDNLLLLEETQFKNKC